MSNATEPGAHQGVSKVGSLHCPHCHSHYVHGVTAKGVTLASSNHSELSKKYGFAQEHWV